MDKEFYTLGLLLSKGKIVTSKDSEYLDIILEIRFNKPTDQSLRSDNITNEFNFKTQPVSMYDYLLPDIIRIWNLLKEVFEDNNVELDYIPEPKDESDFGKKRLRWVIRGIDKNHSFIKYFWMDDSLSVPADLDKVPKKIKLLQRKAFINKCNNNETSNIKNFIQGFVDASGVIPGPESATRGASGEPRIQIEADTSRWAIHVPLMVFFQEIFKVPVVNINWPHPTLKTRKKPKACLGHNHQFRVSLWFFYKNLEFTLSIMQRNLESYIESLDDKYKNPQPTINEFYPNRKTSKKYVSKTELLSTYPDGVTNKTTLPFKCSDHEEDSLKLPPQVRNKHYSYYCDILYEFEDPYLQDYFSNTLNEVKA